MSVATVRVLEPSDAASARAFVSAQLPIRSRYRVRILEQLDIALTGTDAEYTGLIAEDATGGGTSGVLLFGPVAGAHGVVKLHAVVATNREMITHLLDALRASRAHGARRMIMCELPDDAPFSLLSEVLREHGFAREGRVDDFFSDGIALDLHVRPG